MKSADRSTPGRRQPRRRRSFRESVDGPFLAAVALVRQLWESHRLRRSGLFDVGYYLLRYPDVAATGVDPVFHFVRYGASEGRDPSPTFSTARYVAAHPEIALTAENPLLHFARTLEMESRSGAEPVAVPRRGI